MRRFRSSIRITAAGRALLAACASGLLLACPAGAFAHQHRDGLTISGTPASSVTAGQSYAFTPATLDPRERPLSFAIANKPAWASFSTSSGQLAGTPAAASAGTYSNIVIAVSDGIRTATLPAFAVQVLAPASVAAPPPVISGTPPTSVTAGSAYAFQPSASDSSGLPLSFSVQNKPAWAAFSIASGLMSGTPTSAQTGTYANVIISTSDGQHASALPAFSITVNAPASAGGSAVLSVTPPTQNTDGTALTELVGYRIYYGTSPSNLSQLAQLTSSSPSSYTASALASGTWYFGATAYTTAGTESAMSTLVSKTIP